MSEAVAETAGPLFAKNGRTSNDARPAGRRQDATLPGKIEQSNSRSHLNSSSNSSGRVAGAQQSPEQLYSALRSSVLEADSDMESASTLIMAFLSQFYPVSVASTHASRLIEQFGTIASLLRRSAEELVRVVPLSDEAIFMIKVVHRVIASVLREPIENRPVIGTHTALYKYLKFTMIDDGVETVRVLFLNSKNILIKDEQHSTGSIDHCPMYPREIVKRVLELNAVGLIIVHNHPSGDATPSSLDIAMTRQLYQVLDHMGIKLHDHVIVGKNGCVSFRLSKLL